MIAKAAFCRSSATHMPPPADEKSEGVEPPSCFPGALPRPWGHPEPRGGAARRRQTGRYPVRRLSCARCGEAVEGSSPLPGTRTGDTAPGAQPSGNFLPSACGARISSPSLKRFKAPLRTLRSRSVRLIPPASDSPAPDLFAFRGKGMQAPSASMVGASNIGCAELCGKQSGERRRFAKQIQSGLDCGKKEAQWGVFGKDCRKALETLLYRAPAPAGFTTSRRRALPAPGWATACPGTS